MLMCEQTQCRWKGCEAWGVSGAPEHARRRGLRTPEPAPAPAAEAVTMSRRQYLRAVAESVDRLTTWGRILVMSGWPPA